MTKSTTAAETKNPSPDAQSERFKQAARDLECDEDEGHWNERLRKIARPKPTEGNPRKS
jgi:hypothetical protein